jgi:hypothetical protein
MNKKANRRAFFVCFVFCLMYVSVVVRLPERLNISRVAEEPKVSSHLQDMNMSVPRAVSGAPEAPQPVSTVPEVSKEPPPQELTPPAAANPAPSTPAKHTIVHDDGSIEPNLFIAVPIVCHAIKEGQIEKEGLISAKKGEYNSGTWKKPLDIIKDKDEEGLRNISRTIGKPRLVEFLKRAGITFTRDMTPEEIMGGNGYRVEKTVLLALYRACASTEFDTVFPFTLDGLGVTRDGEGFALKKVRHGEGIRTHAREEGEWVMPNLTNLTMRAALEKLTKNTPRIRVHGSGTVTDQQPKPFERLRGETECILYGRTQGQ